MSRACSARCRLGNTLGGTNWPGGGFDPESHVVFVHGQQRRCHRPTRSRTDPILAMACTSPGWRADRAAVAASTFRTCSIVKPPYGVLAAIDLDKGELKWQVPHGETPDVVRDHPALEGPDDSAHRAERQSGTRRDQDAGGHRRSAGHLAARTARAGAMLRAYDKQTGEASRRGLMPAGQTGSPMTYMVDGRQFIVVAIGGAGAQAEYLAFALPERSETAYAVAVNAAHVPSVICRRRPPRSVVTGCAKASCAAASHRPPDGSTSSHSSSRASISLRRVAHRAPTCWCRGDGGSRRPT